MMCLSALFSSQTLLVVCAFIILLLSLSQRIVFHFICWNGTCYMSVNRMHLVSMSICVHSCGIGVQIL